MTHSFAKATECKRFLRFAIAGVGGFVAQIATLAVLVQVFHLHYVAATIVAVEAAILVNFVWHESWTWSDRPACTGAWSVGDCCASTR